MQFNEAVCDSFQSRFFIFRTIKDRIKEKIQFVPRPEKDFVIYKRPKKVLLLGSGGLTIGQAGEFDYSGSQVK